MCSKKAIISEDICCHKLAFVYLNNDLVNIHYNCSKHSSMHFELEHGKYAERLPITKNMYMILYMNIVMTDKRRAMFTNGLSRLPFN